MPEVRCSVCGEPRHIPQCHFDRLRHPEKVTCSLKCRRIARTGEGHWSWKGGRSMNHGYVRVTIRTRRQKRGRSHKYFRTVFEHVLVMERRLKRRLRPNERVFHKNGDRADNRPENLYIKRLKPKPRRRRQFVDV